MRCSWLAIAFFLQAPMLFAAPVSSRRIGKVHFQVDREGLRRLCEKANAPCGAVIDSARPLRADAYLGMISSSATFGDALDEFIRRVPGYRWLDDDGMIRVEPSEIPATVRREFYEQPVNRSFKELDSGSIADSIMPKVPTTKNVLMHITGGGAQPLPVFKKQTIQLKTKSVASALDQIVKADGMAIWFLEFGKETDDPPFTLDLYSWR